MGGCPNKRLGLATAVSKPPEREMHRWHEDSESSTGAKQDANLARPPLTDAEEQPKTLLNVMTPGGEKMELPSSRVSAPRSSTLTSIPHGQPPVLILQQPPGRALRVPLLFPSLPIPYVQNTSYTPAGVASMCGPRFPVFVRNWEHV